MAKVQVVATGRGHDGIQIREEGETFLIDERLAAQYSSWFKPTDPKFKVAPMRERIPAGNTSSEIEALKAQVAQLTQLLTGKTKTKAKGDKPDDDDLV